jgi:hypothetical protein
MMLFRMVLSSFDQAIFFQRQQSVVRVREAVERGIRAGSARHLDLAGSEASGASPPAPPKKREDVKTPRHDRAPFSPRQFSNPESSATLAEV